MSPLVYIVMYGWIPAVLYLFRWLPGQWAPVISFITAWQFLPQAKFPISGLPDYTKMSATCYGILLATVLFDAKRFSSFQPGWLDLPMLVWCICPYVSSVINGLGDYDGIAAVLERAVTWGVPYYLGRLYFNNLDGLSKLAIGIFIGGLIYVPLCLLETRITPQLHRIVYGYHAHDFAQSMRYGGFRPMVFMEHGLMVGAWMMAAALIGCWLWKASVIKQLWGIPIKWLEAGLLFTVVMTRSTGAWILLATGLIILFTTKRFRTSLLVLILIVTMSLYLYIGITGDFPGDQIVSVISKVFGPERAQSLEFRFDNEEILSAKARQRMIFGWGGWERNLVLDDWGNNTTTTDSLWIIVFGINGVVGVISLMASMLLPVLGFMLCYPAKLWHNRKVAPAAALAVVLTLYMLDCLLNDMPNPTYTLACGGLSGLVMDQTRNTKVMGVRLSLAERYLVQQRQQQDDLLAPAKSDGKES